MNYEFTLEENDLMLINFKSILCRLVQITEKSSCLVIRSSPFERMKKGERSDYVLRGNINDTVFNGRAIFGRLPINSAGFRVRFNEASNLYV